MPLRYEPKREKTGVIATDTPVHSESVRRKRSF
jgi:hypothetical protein